MNAVACIYDGYMMITRTIPIVLDIIISIVNPLSDIITVVNRLSSKKANTSC